MSGGPRKGEKRMPSGTTVSNTFVTQYSGRAKPNRRSKRYGRKRAVKGKHMVGKIFRKRK